MITVSVMQDGGLKHKGGDQKQLDGAVSRVVSGGPGIDGGMITIISCHGQFERSGGRRPTHTNGTPE